MRRSLLRTPLLVGGALSFCFSCHGNFDDKRVKTEPTGTLGDDLYSALCDRVGASVLTEDVYGASYHPICHRDQFGKYANQVDQTKLPPVAGGAAVARKLALAKLDVMVRRRADLIAALNATFRDDPVPDPFKPGATIRGHEALKRMLQRIVPLYETNPVDREGSGAREALLPSVTRSTARIFAGIAGPGKDPQAQYGNPDKAKLAQQALARLSGRLGYRPLRVALGAIRPAMAYSDLRGLVQTFGPRMAPGGPLRDSFQNVLGATQEELATSKQQPLPPFYSVDPVFAQPNRPRTNMEVARAIMLSTNPAFAAPGAQPRWLVRRDVRGYAVPVGNTPGLPGSVTGPFQDADGDGFADVEPSGRFVGLAPIDTPFAVPGLENPNRAADGRIPIFDYLNTSETFVGSTTRDLEPLLNPDPAAESEALADLLSGAYALYGEVIDQKAPWAAGGTYKTFDTAKSPIIDLLHATGWKFAHKSSDVHLKMVKKLFTDHEQVVARLIGAALKIREISNQHPEARLDPSVTVWDELQEIIVRTARDPAMFKDVLRSLAHPDAAAYLGPAFGKFSQYKDLLVYDTNNLNGPPANESDPSNPEPHIAVDKSVPDAGNDRSGFHRVLEIIHDVNGVNACNKQDAKVKALGISLPGSYDECELLFFENMGIFYLHSILGKAKLKVRPGFINLLLQIGGALGLDADGVFEDGSGITGMTMSPTPAALNRFCFFGTQSSKFEPFFGGTMPDLDPNYNGKNAKTNEFISITVDPVSTRNCPERLVNVPNASGGEPPQLWITDCSPNVSWQHNGKPGDPKDLLRMRGHGTIFLWEKYDFYKGMRPLLKAFDDHGQGQLFLDSIEVLYRHWSTAEHGTECNNEGNFADKPWQKFLSAADEAAHKVNPAYNPKFCNGSGISRYEPILAEAFAGDLIPALGELVKVLDDPNFVIDDRNGGVPRNGLDVLQETTLEFFDPEYAESVGLTDRFGKKSTTWTNGQIVKRLTEYDLFSEALAKIDVLLPEGSARRVRWRRARSRLVDQFLSIDGEGPNAQFRNQAFAKSVPILLDVLREQVNANCPKRETESIPCQWATVDFAAKAADTMQGPSFSTTMFLLDIINEDEPARRALEAHLRYLVQAASSNDALISMLASSADMMQVLGDDFNMPLIYNAIATAAAPESASEGQKPAPGAADRVMELMDALTREPGQPNPYDPYRIQDRILANLVSPIDPNNENSLTPIEIFLDTFAEVNRYDSSLPPGEPLTPDDFKLVFGTMRDFMADKTRGMEQIYEIMRHRDGD